MSITRSLWRALVAVALLMCCAAPAFADPAAPDLLGPGASAPAAPSAEVPPPPRVNMSAGILVDLGSGKVLWSRDPDVPRPPASLTKILTALVVLEHADLHDPVTVTLDAREVAGARIYAETGWVMQVQDLLWGLLLESGNDAAVALAEKVSPDGTIAGFAKLMNDKARQLGAVHSTFVNPHGLDAPGHLTTARDLAIITSAAMRNPTFAEMVSTVRQGIPWGDGSTRHLTNHNKLLTRYPGTIGVKTGFTNGAGPSLISAVQRGGNTLLAVVLDAPGQTHYAESVALYDWGFANLPALLAHPESTLPAPSSVAGTARARSGANRTTQVGGLDVVQLDRPSPVNPDRRPLTAIGLCVVVAVGIALVFRNPRPVLRTAAPAAPTALETSGVRVLRSSSSQLHRQPPL